MSLISRMKEWLHRTMDVDTAAAADERTRAATGKGIPGPDPCAPSAPAGHQRSSHTQAQQQGSGSVLWTSAPTSNSSLPSVQEQASQQQRGSDHQHQEGSRGSNGLHGQAAASGGDRRSAAGARPSQPGQAPQALSQTAGQGQYAGVSTAAQAPAPSAAAATQRQSSAGAGAGAGAGPHTSSHTSAPQQPLVPHPPEKRDTQERSFQRVSQGGGAGAGRTSQTGGAERVSHTGGGERVSHTGGADRASHSSNSDRVSASSRVPAASQSGEGNARSASQVAEGKAPSSQSSEGKVPSSQAARAAPTSQASTDARKAQGQGQEQAKEQAKEQQKGQQQGQGQAAPRSSPGADAGAREFFTEYGEANRYTILEVIGKGSYGIVCSARDNFTGEKVAIKKITNVFEHVSDATRILREIKLLRLLKHPDIVEIKHIMLPPNPRDYKDIYVVFELMETDLHQVIKANDDLTPEHHQFFLYQMLRGLKYIHSAKVFHRDLKPKNILANADCKLKICDFGLARPAFDNMPTTIFWTDYVATRWYRAPELCGSFFAKYSPAIDLWGVGCIFAEVLLGRPLFPGKNVVNQLELITDLLGTPSPEVIAKVRNEKARRFLLSLPEKTGMSFTQVFLGVDRKALALLKKLLAFDPADRPTAEQALADPYFAGLHHPSREPSALPISKLAFEFDRRKLTMEEVRELIYREVLEYHPTALAAHLSGNNRGTFSHPSALENFKRQFMHLEAPLSDAPGVAVAAGGAAAAGGKAAAGATAGAAAAAGAGAGTGAGMERAAMGNGGASVRKTLGNATSLPKEWSAMYQDEARELIARQTAEREAAAAAAKAAAGAPLEEAPAGQLPLPHAATHPLTGPHVAQHGVLSAFSAPAQASKLGPAHGDRRSGGSSEAQAAARKLQGQGQGQGQAALSAAPQRRASGTGAGMGGALANGHSAPSQQPEGQQGQGQEAQTLNGVSKQPNGVESSAVIVKGQGQGQGLGQGQGAADSSLPQKAGGGEGQGQDGGGSGGAHARMIASAMLAKGTPRSESITSTARPQL